MRGREARSARVLRLSVNRRGLRAPKGAAIDLVKSGRVLDRRLFTPECSGRDPIDGVALQLETDCGRSHGGWLETDGSDRGLGRHPRHSGRARYSATGLFEGLVSFADLERRIEGLGSENDRGDAFEVFAEAYLATQKLHQAAEVWPENTAPLPVIQKLRLTEADKGVDGVLLQLDGAHAAYQVKFRTGRPSLSWTELSTFLGLADRVALRILFTNCDGFAEVVADRREFACIRGADLDRLTEADLASMAAWIRGDTPTALPKTPRPHQAKALADLASGLTDNNRVTAVMACGSGKTLVALWLAEQQEAKRVLVLVPSLALIRQTLHEWSRETSWKAPRFLACCSDPSVTSGVDDAMTVHAGDLDFPVTTDASEVRKFLKGGANDVRVVFSTYQSAQIVGEAIKRLPKFDLGIFDEAHKTAGREALKFGFALADKNIPIARRVFMTATPRHYDVSKRNGEGDKALVYSMDDPTIYGPIVHTLTFAQAARQGIICDAKIIISVVTSEMLNEDLLRRGDVVIDGDAVRARTVANQIALEKACEAHDLKKVFSFHRDVKSAADFTGATVSSIRKHMPTFETLHVSGAMPTARREKHVQAFREAERAILSNARCLTEGVDVPAVDLVAFLSPRKSKVDIVQAAGRAMRKSGDKTTGYVLLPLFLETAEGETLEQALERTGFDEASNVIQAMIEQDDILADIVREMREERGRRGGFDDTRLRERIEVVGPQISIDLIRSAVSTRVVDEFGATWDERFGELVAFKSRHDHCNVPDGFTENPRLSNWVSNQRTAYNKQQLPDPRIARLESIGFVWDPLGAVWEQKFLELAAFKKIYGHCDVPQKYAGNKPLATWLAGQRQACRSNELAASRVMRLTALGVVWEPNASLWERRFGELSAFKAANGHCNVPQKFRENPELARWVRKQRQFRTDQRLDASRTSRLEELGFDWDPYRTQWEQRFAELEAYQRSNGHCDVPYENDDQSKLGVWLALQRTANRAGQLSQDRAKRLENLGVNWEPVASVWDRRFAELADFKRTHRDREPSRGQASEKALAEWIGSQRGRYHSGDLEPDRSARLEALGLSWDRLGSKWEARFLELEEFKRTHAHCNVPFLHSNRKLAGWVRKQRDVFSEGKMDTSRKTRLEALGFVWDRFAVLWEERFLELAEFKAREGHCIVSAVRPLNTQLNSWINTQRMSRRKGDLLPEKIERLDQLGFEWEPTASAWETQFAALRRFHELHGHLRISRQQSDQKKLANWVHTQRAMKQSGSLTSDRIAKLDRLGIDWNPYSQRPDKTWEEMLDDLKAFKTLHGHCRVPSGYAENPALARWVEKQRANRRAGTLASKRMASLDALGFEWSRK
jgi:superfamily II DNA or RNA helicase